MEGVERRAGQSRLVYDKAKRTIVPVSTRMTFVEMLKAIREGTEMQQQQLAKALGISTQHMCDLEAGRRMPSVMLVNRICDYLGRGPKGRLEWHQAGARAHRWEV